MLLAIILLLLMNCQTSTEQFDCFTAIPCRHSQSDEFELAGHGAAVLVRNHTTVCLHAAFVRCVEMDDAHPWHPEFNLFGRLLAPLLGIAANTYHEPTYRPLVRHLGQVLYPRAVSYTHLTLPTICSV